jgi:hypothetical protein
VCLDCGCRQKCLWLCDRRGTMKSIVVYTCFRVKMSRSLICCFVNVDIWRRGKFKYNLVGFTIVSRAWFCSSGLRAAFIPSWNGLKGPFVQLSLRSYFTRPREMGLGGSGLQSQAPLAGTGYLHQLFSSSFKAVGYCGVADSAL